ncbi:hydrolase [Spirochaetia bacterium]|nr:hydrolase [Spirochaetia bacterium]
MNTNDLQIELQNHFEWLHRHPELSGEEVTTTAYIRENLGNIGIEVQDTGMKTGLVAILRGRTGGKTVALRADIDALPIEEKTELVYKSENSGFMHACGHDFHMSALLGAARLLKEKQNEFAGNVKLVFQPAEEITGGALSVLESGALNDVTEIFGMHVMPEKDNGNIEISTGATFAAAIAFSIKILGRGGHAAMPQNCVDPISAAAQLIDSAQCIVSRKSHPQDCVVLSFSHIEAGKTWNVIPDSAFLEGTIRTLGNIKGQKIALVLNDVCHGIEITNGVKIKFQWHIDTPSTHNDPALCQFAKSVAADMGFKVVPFKPTMAGDDFAVYQQKIRGVFMGFGIKSPHGLHNPKFCADTSCLAKAAELMSELALRSLAVEK